ncbi:MAG: SiaC family regulatory phosphoprotein, partial [Chlorobium sp.]|nr:SiaC family regulatory phosphoprotein [Chlorobium sp.]
MKPVDINATLSSPAINFDMDNNTLHIRGESYPENSFDFYEPIISWLKASLQELSEITLD